MIRVLSKKLAVLSTAVVCWAMTCTPVFATQTFLGTTDSASDATEYTFSSFSLGAEAIDRYILVCSMGNKSGNTSFSSMTIAGETATLALSGNPDPLYAIGYALVPTGTTGDIVVTYTGDAAINTGIGVWSISGEGTVSNTDTDFGADTAVNASVALSLDVAESGMMISCGGQGSSGSVTGISFTGLTEDYEESPEQALRHAGASDTEMTQTSGYAVQGDWTNAGSQLVGLTAASFESEPEVGTTTPSVSTSGSYAPTQGEVLFIFGLVLFLASIPFWERVFSLTRGSYAV